MTQTKLVRQLLPASGMPGDVTQEVTRDQSLIRALLVAKLHEEAEEVSKARSLDDVMGELGDLYEVLHSLAVFHGFTMDHVRRAAERKADNRGPILTSDRNGRAVAVIQKAKT